MAVTTANWNPAAVVASCAAVQGIKLPHDASEELFSASEFQRVFNKRFQSILNCVTCMKVQNS